MKRDFGISNEEYELCVIDQNSWRIPRNVKPPWKFGEVLSSYEKGKIEFPAQKKVSMISIK